MTNKRINEMENQERLEEILNRLEKEYPHAHIALDFTTPFELLVATILSAQCTDERVNIVTKPLFQKYRSPRDYVDAPVEELEKDIFSTGFYRAKAKNIKATAAMIINKFNGEVPSTMEELVTLPGVGRKTANVILGHCFNIPGIVVDTHVIRLSNRLGLVNTKDPEKIEFQLMDLTPKEKWVMLTHYFISHGRAVCDARKPRCAECVISDLCPSAFLV